MTLPVHVVESLEHVGVGDEVEVTGDEAHHAVAVRRLRAGEQVAVTDGRGARVVGAVSATGKRSMLVVVAEIARSPEPAPQIVVVQAVPKGDRGELAVEMLTEVGVSRIVPWAASRCVAVWKGERGDKALARWRSTAREAAKQSRRSWHPEVADLTSTAGVTDLVRAADLAIVLHEEGAGSLADLAVPEAGRVVIVVGPEGGVSAEELTALSQAGAHVCRLGDEVLRTSTAGVAASAALLARTSRWR
jgi:16S rRNA (uracil1498-N3)-methyltransferase